MARYSVIVMTEAVKQVLSAFKKKRYSLSRIFDKIEKENLRKKTVRLFLAREPDKKTKEALRAKARALFGADKTVEIKIVPDLIGGFQMKTSQFLVRASVRDFLEEAKKKIYESF